jgi:hypothetical protein
LNEKLNTFDYLRTETKCAAFALYKNVGNICGDWMNRANQIQIVLLLFFVLLMRPNSYAGKVEKGFEALKIYNYFAAKKLFEDAMKRKPSPASFGLATIYYRRDNPFYDLDSAYFYVLRSEALYSSLKEKEKEKWKIHGFDYLNIIELRRNVSTEFYKISLKENTVAAYNRFIVDHSWANERFQAIHKRDSLALNEAIDGNSSFHFQYFIRTYPESEYIEVAIKNFDWLLYKEQTKADNMMAYLTFMKQFPESPHLIDAENRIYELSIVKNVIPEYVNFIKNYPDNHNVGNAWKKIYQLFMYDYSENRISEFQELYPEYPFKDELKRDLRLSRLRLLPYKNGSVFGFMDYDGEIIIEAAYESLGFFKEGLATAVKDGKYGYINKGNEVIIDFQYELALDFEDGRAIVESEGKLGIIDRSGQVIIPLEFEDIGSFSNGLIYGLKDSLYAYYDRIGKQRITEKFEEAFTFVNGLAKVQENGKQAIIDIYGTYYVPPAYEEIRYFSDSIYIFRSEDLYGLMRQNCEVIVPPIYSEIGKLSSNRALIIQDDFIGYIDEKGILILEAKFDLIPNYLDVAQFVGDLAVVSYKGKYGVVNQLGKFVVSPIYNQLGELGSLMAYSKGKGWGFIDQQNKPVLAPKFDYAESFKDSVAIIENLTLFGLIDMKGMTILEAVFSDIQRIDEQRIIVSLGPKHGVYSIKGEELVPVKYQQIRFFNKEFLILTDQGEVHYLYLPENRIISPKIVNE